MFNRPTIVFLQFTFSVAALLTAINGAVRAETIYKSVDQEGKVTYSKTPPADAIENEEIAPPAAPTAEQVREAEERSRQTTELATELEQDRKRREKERLQREAEEQARQSALPPAPVGMPAPMSPYPYDDHPLIPLQPARPSRPPGGSRPTPRPSR